jgi:hypothetical protein
VRPAEEGGEIEECFGEYTVLVEGRDIDVEVAFTELLPVFVL